MLGWLVDGVGPYEEETWKQVMFRPGPKSTRLPCKFHVSCRTVRYPPFFLALLLRLVPTLATPSRNKLLLCCQVHTSASAQPNLSLSHSSHRLFSSEQIPSIYYSGLFRVSEGGMRYDVIPRDIIRRNKPLLIKYHMLPLTY